MKAKHIIFTCAVFLSASALASPGDSTRKQADPALQVSSVLTDNGKRISDYTVILYCEGTATDSFFVSKAKPVYFTLGYGHSWAIQYRKDGYRDRIVLVDTHVGKSVAGSQTFFDYEIMLVREDEASNTIADLPVAIVRYDNDEQQFDYSRQYHRQIRNKDITVIAKNDF